MALAINPLPVPVSPFNIMVVSLSATFLDHPEYFLHGGTATDDVLKYYLGL